MKKVFLSLLAMLLCVAAYSQVPDTVYFTGREQTTNAYVQLSRVTIHNHRFNWTETLIWPDTIAEFVASMGIEDNIANSGLQWSQNRPNPFNGTTDIELMLAEQGTVALEILDVNGRIITEMHGRASLQPGTHQFRINVSAPGIYFLTARQNGRTSTAKLMNNGKGAHNSVEYVGTVETHDCVSLQTKIGILGGIYYYYHGDTMTYIGYTLVDGEEIESEHVVKPLSNSETIILNFTLPQEVDEQACPGVPTVTDYDGNVYNTVQIGNQCWMKENLKTMHYANGDEIPHLDNSSMVDPSFDYPENMVNNVYTYGLLYNWPAVMHGSASSNGNPSGVQGVCPTGWHVPSDAEWQEMEVAVGVPSEDAGTMNAYRGNVAVTLAGGGVNTWMSSTNEGAAGNLNASDRNSTGFSALPAGTVEGMDAGFREMASFWTSTLETDYRGIYRCLHYTQAGVRRYHMEKAMSMSVRCVKD